MIAGDKADSLYMTKEVFENATGTNNKELFLIKGATHIQTYWKLEYVKQISEKLTNSTIRIYNNFEKSII